MAKKKASASGGQLAARGLSPESHIANLKTLNSRLLKSMMEQREQINQLRSEQASLAADSEILDATERDVFRLILSGAAEKMLRKAESAIVGLNSAEMRPVVVEERDGIETDLDCVVEERDLSRRDLDAKRKECERLEEELRSVMREKDIVQRCREDDKRLVEKLGRDMEVMISQKNVDMENSKAENKENALKVEALEEECRLLKKVRGELEDEVGELKVSLKNLREEKVELDADYAEIKKTFLIESGRLRKEKLELEKNYDILNADNKENALKVDALEEECRLLKEIRGKLEYEVGELKVSLEELRKEKVGLVTDYAEVKKSFSIKSGHLKKEKLELKKYDMKEKEMTLQINELKGNMTEMKAEKDLVDQRRAKCEIQVSNLQEKLSELQFARKSLEDAHRCCIKKINRKETECAAMQREKNLEAEAAVALRRQLTESIKANHMVELTLEELQKKLNHLSAENEKKKKQIDSLMVEKSSLERHCETSIQGIDDMEEKLKTFEDTSSQFFARLNKTIVELIGKESAQQNLISRETGAKVDKDEEMKLFVDNLEAVKLVVKGKETKIKELNQELEQLQLFVAYAKNKRGIWKWLFPATTTIFVAAYLAYAAKAR